ncbi:unnamed protein product [Withania somnifera]
MDSVKGALRTSFVTQNQDYGDDLFVAGSGQNAVSGDDFFVDDLLDFSNGFVEGQGEEEQDGEDNSVLKKTQVEETVSVAAKEDFASLPVSEISVPEDNLDSLEWLSHFVEDSFSGYSLSYPIGKLPVEKKSGDREFPVQETSCFVTPVQTKARTKRGRTSGRVWTASSGSLTESSSSSSSSSSATTMSPSPNAPWLLYPTPVHTAESSDKPVAKKLKKKPVGHGGNGFQQPRRCSHCGVQKTPQWRAGPMGAKTLCNACGVRFKSGRLLPEYRPACSPTFSSELHSNNHRKVLEMRRKKESEESGLAQPVKSF